MGVPRTIGADAMWKLYLLGLGSHNACISTLNPVVVLHDGLHFQERDAFLIRGDKLDVSMYVRIIFRTKGIKVVLCRSSQVAVTEYFLVSMSLGLHCPWEIDSVSNMMHRFPHAELHLTKYILTAVSYRQHGSATYGSFMNILP